MALAINHNSTQCQKNHYFNIRPSALRAALHLLSQHIRVALKRACPIFNSIFQMACKLKQNKVRAFTSNRLICRYYI